MKAVLPCQRASMPYRLRCGSNACFGLISGHHSGLKLDHFIVHGDGRGQHPLERFAFEHPARYETVTLCVFVTAARAEGEISQAVDDGFALVDLDALNDVRVMSINDIRAELDGLAPHAMLELR